MAASQYRVSVVDRVPHRTADPLAPVKTRSAPRDVCFLPWHPVDPGRISFTEIERTTRAQDYRRSAGASEEEDVLQFSRYVRTRRILRARCRPLTYGAMRSAYNNVFHVDSRSRTGFVYWCAEADRDNSNCYDQTPVVCFCDAAVQCAFMYYVCL